MNNVIEYRKLKYDLEKINILLKNSDENLDNIINNMDKAYKIDDDNNDSLNRLKSDIKKMSDNVNKKFIPEVDKMLKTF